MAAVSTRVVALGAAGLGIVYAASNCLFNVESGKRGIVYNRIGGIKDTVRMPVQRSTVEAAV